MTCLKQDCLSVNFIAMTIYYFLSGILSARLLGQKKDKFDSVSTTTAQEFFANYPMLYSYMLKLLQETIPNSENR